MGRPAEFWGTSCAETELIPREQRRRLALQAALLALGVALSFTSLATPASLNIDQARYLVTAHHLEAGVGYSDWRGPETHIHPLHPFLITLAGDSVSSLELRGRWITCAASVLLLLPLAVLAGRLTGGRGVTFFLLLAALHPRLLAVAGGVQPESLHALLVCLALCLLLPVPGSALRATGWVGAGILFGLAYLARPEGFLIGLLSAGIAFFQARRSGRSGARGPILFVAGLLLAASPYLLFLWQTLGTWGITGKAADLFFIGQARYAGGGSPPEASSYLALKSQWGGILAYAATHPGRVLGSASRNALQILGETLPRILGPAAILGCVAAAGLFLRRRDLRGSLLLVASPALTLCLMIFTYPNELVALSTVPFFLVLASAGLSSLAARLDSARKSTRLLGASALLALVLAGWGGAPQFLARRGARGDRLEQRAIGVALEHSGDLRAVASSHPVISFHTRDPLLLGPPGRYRPLPVDGTCAELAQALQDRGARVAILDRAGRPPGIDLDAPECPLRIVSRLRDPSRERWVWVVAFAGERGSPPFPGTKGVESP